jgi:hypothetical protein
MESSYTFVECKKEMIPCSQLKIISSITELVSFKRNNKRVRIFISFSTKELLKIKRYGTKAIEFEGYNIPIFTTMDNLFEISTEQFDRMIESVSF